MKIPFLRAARLVLAFLAAALPHALQAQAFPAKTVTLIVPYAAGGLPDTFARVMAPQLSEKWGQSVVVENRPGGNGVLAAQALAARAPDGHALLVTDGAMFSINPVLHSRLPYDPDNDFTFIALAARAPLFLAVGAAFPADGFAQFVQVLKAEPGKHSYGSSGVGSITHLAFELAKAGAGVDIVHGPFTGMGQAVPAVVGGQVAAVWSAMPALAGFAKDKRVKLIAVGSAKRSALAPSVATVAESGIPGFDIAPNLGFSGPAGMPDALVSRIAADVVDVLKDRAVAERLVALGIDAVGEGPREYAQLLAADRVRFDKVVKAAGIKPD